MGTKKRKGEDWEWRGIQVLCREQAKVYVVHVVKLKS